MKKLYRRKVTAIHPSPPLLSDHLAFLPPTILTLAAALSPEDREVLAYLISCSSFANHSSSHQRINNTHKKIITTSTSSSGDHPPSFSCDCFRCYTSYWVRWDSSPSRQTIHEIIDAFEDGQLGGQRKREKSSRRERRKRGGDQKGSGDLKRTGSVESELEEKIGGSGGENCSGGGGGEVEEGVEKGSVRKFVSFVGEKFWSTVWS